MLLFFNQKTSGLQKYLAMYAHLWYSEEGYYVLEWEIESLKASELKDFFDLTVGVLIYSSGFFSQTSSDKNMSKEMTRLCRDYFLTILLLVLFAPSKYTLFPTSLSGKAGVLHPQNSRHPREHQGLSVFPPGIIGRQRA